jgi:WD40 repeat protein
MLKRFLTIILSVTAISAIAACQAGSPSAAPSALPVCFTPLDLHPIAFMPDSSGILIRGTSGVQVFNLETMKEEKFIQAPKNITSAALASDGQTLAWALEDYSLQLVQVSDGKTIHTLKGHSNAVFKLRFSSTSDKLFSASHDGSVRIWDDKGDLLQVIETGGEIVGIGVSQDGTKLATIPFDGPVELWDLVTNRKITTLGGTGGYDTSEAVFSPDGKYLAADIATGLFLWRLSDGQLMWNEVKNSLAVAFSPDGRFLAYSNVDDHNKVILSSPDGTQIIRTLEGMQALVWDLIFSPNSSLVAATDGGEIRIWQVEAGKLLYIGKATC